MVRFADGERAAFREVFEGLWPHCLSLAKRSLGDRAEAEDTAQRSILKVFDRIVDFDRDRDGVSWALTITAFVSVAVIWMWLTEGQKPDRWDVIGAAVALCGMALIVFGPRGK